MCLRRSGFRIAARDVLLGVVEGCPFYVGAAQFPYWANCQITLDVTAGGGDSFSLEAADGVRFLVRSRLFSDAEWTNWMRPAPPWSVRMPRRDTWQQGQAASRPA